VLLSLQPLSEVRTTTPRRSQQSSSAFVTFLSEVVAMVEPQVKPDTLPYIKTVSTMLYRNLLCSINSIPRVSSATKVNFIWAELRDRQILELFKNEHHEQRDYQQIARNSFPNARIGEQIILGADHSLFVTGKNLIQLASALSKPIKEFNSLFEFEH
jgi:hypothetical protein